MDEKEPMNLIEQTLSDILDEMLVALKTFHKKTYSDEFKAYFEIYKNRLELIPMLYHESGDSTEVLDTIAEFLPKKVEAVFAKESSKRKKDGDIISYNMAMVTYTIPLISYVKDDCMDLLADKIIECWNETFTKMKIGKSTFQTIEGGFKKGLCYITTAICQSQNKPDDCYELNVLRQYRDEYLLEEKNGSSIVKEYYNLAPTIVSKINRQENSKQIYDDIWESYLKPCVSLIESNKKEECKEIYTKMVRCLQQTYLYN